MKNILDERNIDPRKIRSGKDLEKLPVISREQLVKIEIEEPPFGGLCGKDVKIDRIFASPGPFTSRIFQKKSRSGREAITRPVGSQWQNGYIQFQSYNAKLRDDLLKAKLFIHYLKPRF
jgi:phenylacetate-CoA ligase